VQLFFAKIIIDNVRFFIIGAIYTETLLKTKPIKARIHFEKIKEAVTGVFSKITGYKLIREYEYIRRH
jgi:hypothetical protein